MADIDVVNRNNKVVSIDQGELPDALKQGYRVATPEEAKASLEKHELTSGVQPFIAGLEGAARAATFGGSDVLLGNTVTTPERLKKREELNPGEAIAGELGMIGASLLVPGYGQATAARGIGRAALRAATAPIRGATALGQAVTRGAAEALPAATALGRAAQVGASHAIGGAAEGALYGAGRVVTESAMGDPGLNGESIFSHIGLSALLGGGASSALGLTGMGVEGVAKGLRKVMPERPMPETGPAVINTPKGKEAVITAPDGTLQRAAQEMGMDATKTDELMKASRKLKPNHKEIVAGSEIAELPVFESIITSDKRAQHFQTMLLDSPSMAGDRQRELFESAYNKAAKNYDDVIATSDTRSAHEMGKVQVDLLRDQVDSMYNTSKQQYKKLGPDAENVLVPEKRILDVMGDFLEKADNPPPGAAIGGPRKKLFEHWAERIQDQKTLGNLDGLYSDIGSAERAARRAGLDVDAHVLGEIKTTLKEFQDNIIDEAHLSYGKASGLSLDELSVMARSLKDDRRLASKTYAKFVEVLGDLSGAAKLGRGKMTHGRIMQALDKIEPSKLAENVFRGDRINALTKLQKEFPAAFDLFAEQFKKELYEASLKGGVLDAKIAAKKIDALPKEVQAMLFEPEQIAKMNGTKLWLDNLPQDWAPSKTPRGMMYMDYYNSPAKAAMAEVVGKAQEMYIKTSVKEMSAIVQLEKAAKKSLNKINTAAKALFSDQVVAFSSSKAAEAMISHEKPKDTIKRIREIANNPELMINELAKGAESIQEVAPQTAQSMQISASRAIQYLNMVAPETTSQYPLGDDPEPSRAELNIFSERMNVIKNPTILLDEMKTGSLTPEHVEIVSSIYPKMYAQMQSSVMEQMTNALAKKKPISYKMKNMLSLFLNQDLDDSITAQAIMQNQEAHARSAQNAQAQQNAMGSPVRPTQKGLGGLDSSMQAMMPMQKSALRIDA